MAELAGDDGDVDAFGAELGGVGVAESVGVDALVDARPGGEAFEHDPDVGVRHGVATERAEHGVAAAQAEAGPGVEPALDDGGGAGVQTDGAGSPAFAVEHANAAVGEFEVLGVEAEGFVDTQSGVVEQGDQCPVA